MRTLSKTTVWTRFVVLILLGATGCGSSLGPAPTPTPIPTAIPTATPSAPPPTSTPAPAYMDLNMPGCDGFQELPSAVSFDWPGLADIQDVDSWQYYRCTQSPADVAALYHGKMVKPPYNWQEISWVELPEGKLGAYFHAVRQSYLYLWFLNKPEISGTLLVAAPRQGNAPLDLPCCH